MPAELRGTQPDQPVQTTRREHNPHYRTSDRGVFPGASQGRLLDSRSADGETA
jgi:hypothetical protein